VLGGALDGLLLQRALGLGAAGGQGRGQGAAAAGAGAASAAVGAAITAAIRAAPIRVVFMVSLLVVMPSWRRQW
jgi:hypothetical protein